MACHSKETYPQSIISKGILSLIRVYQFAISALMGPCCRFEPSCSNYAMEAIQYYGSIKGSWLALKRILRCHPWHPGGEDPLKRCPHQGKLDS